MLNNKPLFITIILMVVLVILLIITAGTEGISGTQSIVGSVLEPVHGAFYSATQSVVNFFRTLTSQNEIALENNTLKEQVNELTGQLTELEEMRSQNERLKLLLEFKDANSGFTTVGAQVTGRTPSQWFSYFTINVGVSDGVTEGMVVVAAEGLVGKIVGTGANWARVQGIIDGDSGVSGIIERTRDNGVLTGTVEAEGTPSLLMQYLPYDSDVIPGDSVVTSGLDEVYPKGIIIGSVSTVATGKDNLQTSAVVIPSVDFYHLEEVLVITGAADGQ